MWVYIKRVVRKIMRQEVKNYHKIYFGAPLPNFYGLFCDDVFDGFISEAASPTMVNINKKNLVFFLGDDAVWKLCMWCLFNGFHHVISAFLFIKFFFSMA